LQGSSSALQNDLDHKVAAVLYGYFALTGAHEESAISCLAGFIAEADDWNEFDHAWSALLADSSSGFDATACFHGTGAFQSWDIRRRHAMVAGLSEVLARSALVPVGTFVVREHFSRLSSADRAILSAEGIESPLDLIFYDWTERIICQVHDQSEKISLLFCHDSQAEQYREFFNKHLGRYMLGPHLAGDLAFAQPRDYNHLQAAQLLSETALLIETQEHFPRQADTSFPIPQVLQQITDQVLQQGRFDAAALHRLTGRLKGPNQKSTTPKQEPRS
jgi:hypothetical protein